MLITLFIVAQIYFYVSVFLNVEDNMRCCISVSDQAFDHIETGSIYILDTINILAMVPYLKSQPYVAIYVAAIFTTSRSSNKLIVKPGK